MSKDLSTLERTVQFHGHICPGLLMGFRAAEFAREFLGLGRDQDEELVAIVENKACGVDAIQVVLGCTFGKGNLIFRDYGKHVYTIISREQNRAVRISQKFGTGQKPDNKRYRSLLQKDDLSPDEAGEIEDLRQRILEDILSCSFDTIFDHQEVTVDMPEKAQIHPTLQCEVCGEGVMETRAEKTEQGITCPSCLSTSAGNRDLSGRDDDRVISAGVTKFPHSVLETLGIQYTEYTPERVVATMEVTPKTHQPLGLLHGGVSVVLAESVASYGSYQFIDPERQGAVGLEINANHIRSKKEGTIKAIGVPVHIGRTTLVWDIRIVDEQEKLVCISRCTMAVVDIVR